MLKTQPPARRPSSFPTEGQGAKPDRHQEMDKKAQRFLEATQGHSGKVFNLQSRRYVLVANRQVLDKCEMTGTEAKTRNQDLIRAFQESIGADGRGTIPLARWCVARKIDADSA